MKTNNVGDAMGMPDRCQTDAPTPTPTPIRETPNGVSSPETAVSGRKSKAGAIKKPAYTDAFEAVWKAYPTTRNMSKAEGFAEWQKLDADDRQKLAAAIPGFVEYCRANPDYRPIYLERFISKRRFDGYAEGATQHQPSTADWRKRLLYARNRQQWSTSAWGPMPGTDGCLVPPDLLQRGDGEGWFDRMEGAA